MNQIILDLISFIATLQLFQKVDYYRNEFYPGSDWNPVFPCCLIKAESMQSDVYSSKGEQLHYTYVLTLYVADRINPADTYLNALILAESLFQSLNGVSIDHKPIKTEVIKFVETGYGTEIYSIQISI